ncbi:MAG: UTP--glucose-1-phosphate uridylyltransferase [Clostridia bacterium]|nr:UTP--glucose-1-phosphate uridylyltransferase [Clostridia bacterium]
MIEKAVILCGGYETRMLPITKTIPKTMLPVFDKPLIQCIMEELKECGIKKVCFIIDDNKQIVLNHFKRNVDLEMYLQAKNKYEMLESVVKTNNMLEIEKRNDNHLGAGYAIEVAKDFVGDEPFVFCLSDEYLENNGNGTIKQLMANYYKYGKPVIAVQEVPRSEVFRYGIIDPIRVDEQTSIVKNIVEKPSVEQAPSNISYLGNAILDKEVFSVININKIKGRKEINIPDLFENYIRNQNLLAVNIVGNRFDLGNKLGFVKANINAGLKDKTYGNELAKYICDLADIIRMQNR